MANIEIYTKGWCAFCKRAKSLLSEKGLEFVELDVTYDFDLETEMRIRANRWTVPQVFIDGHHIGGSDDLSALARSGDLDVLIAQAERDKSTLA